MKLQCCYDIYILYLVADEVLVQKTPLFARRLPSEVVYRPVLDQRLDVNLRSAGRRHDISAHAITDVLKTHGSLVVFK